MMNASEQIKERLSITEVLSSYIKIERSGQNYKARCPFHNEKTASFFISPGRGSYYCFGCGVKGDIFSFVQAIEGLDFKGALKLLADRAGIVLSGFKSENTDEKEKLFAVMEAATSFYESELSKNPEAKKYLLDRGLSEETIASFRLGFAPDGWRTLSTHLSAKKFAEQLLEKAGLIKKTDKGYYDRFRNRVMFPIADSTGRIIAFSGRTLVVDDTTPKYLNSPDTPLFDKSSALYGIDRAKDAIRKRDYAIIVEGQFDLILSHQAGFVNTVAASGTALSDTVPTGDRGVTNLHMIGRFSKNILFAFDGDKAGINAAYRGSLLALGLAMDVKVAKLPEGKDPADVILNSKEDWITILKETDSAVSFFAKRVMTMNSDGSERVKLIQKLVLPLIGKMESALMREHFLSKVEEITGASIGALKSDLSTIEKDDKKVSLVEEKEDRKKKNFTLGERLLGIILWQREMASPLVSPDELEEKLKEAVGEDRLVSLKDGAADHKNELIFEAEAGYADSSTLGKEFDRLLLELQLRECRRTLETLAEMMRLYEKEGKDTEGLLEEARKTGTLLHTIESKLEET